MKQNITQYIMVALLVVGAYMVGVYKTKVEYLEGGVPAQVAEVAGEQDVVPEEVLELSDEQWSKVQENPVFARGEDSAPVTIVEFTDYECPFCARYVDDTYGQIMTNYVETGKVRYMVRDLPLPFHNHAIVAAASARCAEQNGQYESMHEMLFSNQDTWAQETDATEIFVGYAAELGLSATEFRDCIGSDEILSAIDADSELASSIGANGTPTFYVNGTALVGAQPYAAFQAAIEAEL